MSQGVIDRCSPETAKTDAQVGGGRAKQGGKENVNSANQQQCPAGARAFLSFPVSFLQSSFPGDSEISR